MVTPASRAARWASQYPATSIPGGSTLTSGVFHEAPLLLPSGQRSNVLLGLLVCAVGSGALEGTGGLVCSCRRCRGRSAARLG